VDDDAAKRRDAYFVPIERIQKHADAIAAFEQSRELCAVYFGEASREPFNSLLSIVIEIQVAARALIRTADREPSTPRAMQDHIARTEKYEAVIYGFGDEDPITPKVDAAIREIEKICLAHVRPPSKPKWWRRRGSS
jgi:hypothetical protein